MKSKPSVLPSQKFLTQLALGAGKILTRYYTKVSHIRHKAGAGIVTEADKAAEDFLVKKILSQFPNSSIIAEEGGESIGDGALTWIIDPLDGTTNYAHGFHYFCVSIGVYLDGRAEQGVIWAPILGDLFYSQRGKGTRLNGKRVYVSSTRSFKTALLATGFYYAKGEILAQECELFRRVNERALGVRRPGAAALDLAYVSAGRFDGFWERGLSPWDVAAGFLMIDEAGGKISNYGGKKVTIFDREVVATNGSLHAPLVKLLS